VSTPANVSSAQAVDLNPATTAAATPATTSVPSAPAGTTNKNAGDTGPGTGTGRDPPTGYTGMSATSGPMDSGGFSSNAF
ncbi:MAG: hypothetical protein Q9164_003808, partial [Protoblastenia rupestris]